MSRAGDERIADILDAAREIAEVVDRGRRAWEADRLSQLAVNVPRALPFAGVRDGGTRKRGARSLAGWVRTPKPVRTGRAC